MDFWERRLSKSWLHIPITFKIGLATYLAELVGWTREILSNGSARMVQLSASCKLVMHFLLSPSNKTLSLFSYAKIFGWVFLFIYSYQSREFYFCISFNLVKSANSEYADLKYFWHIVQYLFKAFKIILLASQWKSVSADFKYVMYKQNPCLTSIRGKAWLRVQY